MFIATVSLKLSLSLKSKDSRLDVEKGAGRVSWIKGGVEVVDWWAMMLVW